MPNLAMKHWKTTLKYEPKNYKVLSATKLEEDLAKLEIKNIFKQEVII